MPFSQQHIHIVWPLLQGLDEEERRGTTKESEETMNVGFVPRLILSVANNGRSSIDDVVSRSYVRKTHLGQIISSAENKSDGAFISLESSLEERAVGVQ